MGPPSVNLVAWTRNPNGSQPPKPNTPRHDSFFKSVQWSADGTTLFTLSHTNRVCAFVLPENLLEPRPSPIELTAQSTIALPEPTTTVAPCPYFALENPATQVFLSGCTDHPIQLHHFFPPSSSSSESQPTTTTYPPLATFRLIKKETEAYLRIASLIWPRPGTHFIAGTENKIALFDVSRPDTGLSTEPLLAIPTIPSTRHISKGGGVGMRGTVSALSISPQSMYSSYDGFGGGAAGVGGGLLAAGTWTRSLGLYDLFRSASTSACVATWSVAPAASEAGIGGNGVMQLAWSPCGRYLLVNERNATGLLVYDVRSTRRLLAVLKGWDGRTNQRLACDVFPGTERVGGFEVWAGTVDGEVVVYEGVGNAEGSVEPSWKWKVGGGEAAVGGVGMHLSGSVVATCSGSWKFRHEEDDSSSEDEESSSDESGSGSESSSSSRRRRKEEQVYVEETSLKVWSLGPAGPPSPSAEEYHEERN
ncbi:hypothetical protein VTJ04DRAFT_5293 [Mycothermus thermophilus]|uniref:uncharacterized protein n=1 Tax=Humicola insolens TaxID=85995 RepID=UPI00374495A3